MLLLLLCVELSSFLVVFTAAVCFFIEVPGPLVCRGNNSETSTATGENTTEKQF